MKEYIRNITMWLVITFCFGIAAGGAMVYKFNAWQLDQATRLGNMIHSHEIWDLKKRL